MSDTIPELNPPLESVDLVKAPHEGFAAKEKFQVSVAAWHGPYDLLLQVIEEQNLNLLDLDISVLLHHYLDYLEKSLEIDIDEAGDFIVVGATLAQIKSKLLLPKDENEVLEEEKDPREDLVRYLMEYQKIKQAADQLRDRPLLGRDVFTKGIREHFEGIEGEGHGTLFQLVKGFQTALRDLRASQPMSFEMEHVSVSDRLHEIIEILKIQRELCFEDLLPPEMTKVFIIATFLATLELVRLKQIQLFATPDRRVYLRLKEAGGSENLISEFDEALADNSERNIEDADTRSTH